MVDEEQRIADERSTVFVEAREETLVKVKDRVPREFHLLIYAGTRTTDFSTTCQRERVSLEGNAG